MMTIAANPVHRTKYLSFHELDPEPGQTTIRVLVNTRDDHPLGAIVFKPQWRRFVFQPGSACVFDGACLLDISTELNKLTERWRLGR